MFLPVLFPQSPAVIEGVNRIFGKKRKSEDQEAGALRKQWGKHLQARYNQLNIAFQHTQRALELHEAGYLEESAFNFSLAIAEYFRCAHHVHMLCMMFTQVLTTYTYRCF